MSSPFRMITSITSILMILLGVFFLFLNTSLDDQRSTAVRQVSEVNLNRKAARTLPGSNDLNNQKVLSKYNLKTIATSNDIQGWTVTGATPVTEFEQAVWQQLYSRFGTKLQPVIKNPNPVATTYGPFNGQTRTLTWSRKNNNNPAGTLVFSYLYKPDVANNTSLDDVYAVKVQAMISGRSYTTNLAVIHDSNNLNYGLTSSRTPLRTQVGTMSPDDYKSGENIAQTFTSDTGYNVVWDSEFVQKPIKNMDHIRLTYTFNQDGQSVAIPDNLNKIFTNIPASSNRLPVELLTSGDLKNIQGIDASQVKIKNASDSDATATVELTLTKAQSAQFMNLDFNNHQRMLFRAYTQIDNQKLKFDYATAQSKLETLDANGKVLYTQTSDVSKVRITPFAIQPIDTGMSLETVQTSLTTYINKMYGKTDTKAEDVTATSTNKGTAAAQYKFAKDGNTVVAVNKK